MSQPSGSSKGYGFLFGHYSGWTDHHGISHIYDAQSMGIRIFWILLLLLTVIGFSWNANELHARWSSKEIGVNHGVTYKERNFPAFTFCPMNLFLLSRIHRAPELQKLVEDYKTRLNGRLVEDDYYGFNTVTLTSNMLTDNGTVELTDQIAVQEHAKEVLNLAASDYLRTSTNGFEDITNSLSEIVLSCTFRAEECNVSRMFSEKSHPVYGRCFVFNDPPPEMYTPKPDPFPFISDRSGGVDGIKLTLKVNHSDNLYHSETSGFRVAIHKQGEEAYPDTFGYNAGTNYRTSFFIKFIETRRVHPPHGTCTTALGTGPYYYSGDYTVEGCVRSCVAQQIIDNCGCADPRYRYPPKTRVCTIKDLRCMRNYNMRILTDEKGVERDFSDEWSACECQQPCVSQSYEASSGISHWPVDGWKPDFCNPSKPRLGEKWRSWAACSAFYSRNSLVMDLAFERLDYQLVEEYASYDTYRLLADLGGQIGLWFGGSLITLIELLSFLFFILLKALSKKNISENLKLEEKKHTKSAFDGKQLNAIS